MLMGTELKKMKALLLSGLEKRLSRDTPKHKVH